MPSRVHLGPRHGVKHAIFHWIRVAAAFCLAGMASYCTTGNFTHTATYEQLESSEVAP